jgi:pimeloyl-ACP methyl ester carboxylesterase
MLLVRAYGQAASPPLFVLHGGPGAAGHMAPVARGLAARFHVLEPFQRRGGAGPLTVAQHVADLHAVIGLHAPNNRPSLVGASWGAMLALAYGAAHPETIGPLVLVGCGTFDVSARAIFKKTMAERMDDATQTRLRQAERLNRDKALKASAEALTPIYSYDPITSAHADDEVDAQAHDETWNDMLRLQAEGFYPAAFAAIKSPVLMVHGTFDPHPGRLIRAGLQPHLPQLEYCELDRCGHYPWLERHAADRFFSLLREWLQQHVTDENGHAASGESRAPRRNPT